MIAINSRHAVEYASAIFIQELTTSSLSSAQKLTPPSLWVTIFIILMILAMVLVLFVGLRLIKQRRNRLGQSRYRLQITNKGNLVAHYWLRALEPGNVLAFSFLVNGVELKPPAAPAIKQPESSPTPQMSPAKPKASPVAQPARPMPRSNFMKRTSQFRQASGPIARLLSGLSFLLPNSVRMGMYQSTAKFRGIQYKVTQADNLAKKAGSVSLRGQKPAAPGRSESKPESTRERRLGTPQLAPTESSATDTPVKRESPRPDGLHWVTSPAMSPGENLTVELLITPRNPRLSQEYTFKILSRCAEWVDSPEAIESCSLQVKGISWLNYLWPYAALVMSIFAVLVVFTLLIRTYVLV